MTKEYKQGDLTVVWDNTKCTHSAICAKGLPTVFKPRERPWIQLENEDNETIRQQVLKCPSKALSLKDNA